MISSFIEGACNGPVRLPVGRPIILLDTREFGPASDRYHVEEAGGRLVWVE